jgi:hypothetical protein
MTEPSTHTLDVRGAVLTYDVREPEEVGGLRPLFIFGSPMGASGFEQLVSHFGDRTVITYDPRGMERSTRTPGGELTAETMPRTTTASSRRRVSARWTPSGRAGAGCVRCTGSSHTRRTSTRSSPTSPHW